MATATSLSSGLIPDNLPISSSIKIRSSVKPVHNPISSLVKNVSNLIRNIYICFTNDISHCSVNDVVKSHVVWLSICFLSTCLEVCKESWESLSADDILVWHPGEVECVSANSQYNVGVSHSPAYTISIQCSCIFLNSIFKRSQIVDASSNIVVSSTSSSSWLSGIYVLFI